MSAFRVLTADTATVGTSITFPNRITTSNMPSGTANSILTTDGSGLPSYSTSLQVARLFPGSSEQSLWTVGGVPQWRNYSSRYGLVTIAFQAQDWNAAATNALSFNSIASAFSTYGPNTFTNISVQTPSTTLLCNSSAYYRFSLVTSLSNSGIDTVNTRFNVLINGVAAAPGPAISVPIGQTQSLCASIVLLVAQGQTITFRSTRISGTSALTNDNTNSLLAIELVTIVN